MTREVEVRLNNEMGQLQVLHDKEPKLWQAVKERYKENTASIARNISNLKMTFEEMRMHTEMNVERIKILLATTHNRFMHQLQEVLNTGWAEWAMQATKLHTYWANWENRAKRR